METPPPPPPRKRFVRLELDGAARFLTFSCHRRLPLFANDRLKSRFVERLTQTLAIGPTHAFAWVVMPEHVHLVLLPANAGDVTRFSTALKGAFAREVISRWQALDAPILARVRTAGGATRFWQHGGGHDRIVIAELAEKIRYCHANPVVRGPCASSIDWPWSSARAYEERDDYAGPLIAFEWLPRLRGPLT